MSIAAAIASASRGLLGELPRGLGAAVSTFDFLLETFAVAALFHYVPNTVVRWRHAILGGLFVAICLSLGKRALTPCHRHRVARVNVCDSGRHNQPFSVAKQP